MRGKGKFFGPSHHSAKRVTLFPIFSPMGHFTGGSDHFVLHKMGRVNRDRNNRMGSPATRGQGGALLNEDTLVSLKPFGLIFLANDSRKKIS